MYKTGKDYYLMNKDGVLFKKLGEEDDVDLPVITGYAGDDKTNAAMLKKTAELLKQLTMSKNFPTISNVAEIGMSEGVGLSLVTDNGYCLKLGFDNYGNKLQRLLPVITALNKKNIKQEYYNIDLRQMDKIYVERRDVQQPVERVIAKKGFST